MFSRGEYSDKDNTYGVILKHTKTSVEALLILSNTVVSAYKSDITGNYSYNNNRAKELVSLIQKGIKKCTSKNNSPTPYPGLGAVNQHEFSLMKYNYTIRLFQGEIVEYYMDSDDKPERIELQFADNVKIPSGIPYVKLTNSKQSTKDDELSDEEPIITRTVEEIALDKEDVSWLKNKKYYIVNDDETAEKIFSFLDNYAGPIAYDTETTGLRINCFGKVNSSYSKELEKYNNEHPDDQITADRLVGIIFCVEKDVSYYFPCFNRKFKNLYEDSNSPIRIKIINNIKARYTVGDLHNLDTDMAHYVRETPAEDFRLDVILMERCRDILTTRHIVTHGGSFDWKVNWLFEIDTNICDDTILMHQLMYKFRSTTANSGEPSKLKYLAKRELGVDQWELSDFFPEFKEDKSGTIRNTGGKKKKKIDFSYMDYDGTRIYAPCDGDMTLELFLMYKKDLKENHQELEYIYNVELLVEVAIGYMEFYGHRIDESKIHEAKLMTDADKIKLESKIRQIVKYSNNAELAAYDELSQVCDAVDAKSGDHDELMQKLQDAINKLSQTIADNTEHTINLASPSQVGELFFDILNIPFKGEKKSVAKNVIKGLLKERNEDGTLKYPVVELYSKWKNADTLNTKFFDNLPNFMYPGGFIFSSYGQISTATGRMSCSKPNAQQYPKVITKIVIPRDGFIMCDADYSQIEYRVLTALAHNSGLAELFSNPDSDYHTLMASLMYEVDYSAVTPQMRSAAKSFNFGIPYGMGFRSLAILLTGKATPQAVDEAKEKYEQYFKNQPNTRKFFDNIKEAAQVNKYTKTLFNRYRYYSFEDKDGNINQGKKAAALRQAGNAVIQGCIHGDTKIETKEFGIKPIRDLVGYSGLVWNGTDWTHGDVLYSGKKQKCIVTFTNGQRFVCSPIHRFKIAPETVDEFSTINPHWKNDTKVDGFIGGYFVRCEDLKIGQAICINEQSHLVINDYTNRYHNVECVTGYDDDSGGVYNYTDKISCVIVDSVEITGEYIDMYDVCNTDCGYYVADGIVTHNTAADIFKIGVARNISFIRKYKLYGKMLIINMIHDEQLMEIDVQHLNPQRILAEVGRNMQFQIENFPPLYIGAGIGPAWGYAKGKMAEIHPLLLDQLSKEADNIPIYRDNQSEKVDTKQILDYFSNRVLDFRRKKVAEYLSNPENWHQQIHPAIGSLINLQFNYGRGDDAKAYTGPNGEKYSDQEFLELNIADFLKENNIQAEASWFKASELEQEKDDDDAEYDDDENEDEFDEDLIAGDADIKVFSLVDESDKTFGSSVQDLIGVFGACVLEQQKICGIDMRDVYYKEKDAWVEFLAEHACEPNAPGALQVVFLLDGNILNNTNAYVNNIKASDIEANYKKFKHLTSNESDYSQGDVKTRSQAK